MHAPTVVDKREPLAVQPVVRVLSEDGLPLAGKRVLALADVRDIRDYVMAVSTHTMLHPLAWGFAYIIKIITADRCL